MAVLLIVCAVVFFILAREGYGLIWQDLLIAVSILLCLNSYFVSRFWRKMTLGTVLIIGLIFTYYIVTEIQLRDQEKLRLQQMGFLHNK